MSLWLNHSAEAVRTRVCRKGNYSCVAPRFRTWRYFAEFSTEEHNWLIPDNVQEDPYRVAARVSPTNVGLLLNARQVACEFGYLTVSEFSEKQRERWPPCVA